MNTLACGHPPRGLCHPPRRACASLSPNEGWGRVQASTENRLGISRSWQMPNTVSPAAIRSQITLARARLNRCGGRRAPGPLANPAAGKLSSLIAMGNDTSQIIQADMQD